jgi:hypothetical protein
MAKTQSLVQDGRHVPAGLAIKFEATTGKEGGMSSATGLWCFTLMPM